MSRRIPPPLPPIPEWVERYAGVDPEAGPEALAPGAARALQASLRIPSDDREAAWALLAADALVTWGVEDAASATDPEAALDALLDFVAGIEAGHAGHAGLAGHAGHTGHADHADPAGSAP